jgi:hypothetical protein
MLCDEVLANLCPTSGLDITPLLPRIKRAQKFVLSAEFAAVAEELSNHYDGLLRLFPHCRLPYPDMWFEVVQADRPQFSAASMHIPKLQMIPKRVGFLLTALRNDLSAWKAHLFWSVDGYGTSTSVAATTYDMIRPIHHFTEVVLPPEAEEEIQIGPVTVKNFGAHPGWEAATEAVRLAITNHTDLVISDARYVLPGLEEVPPEEMGDVVRLTRHLARADWAGEGTFQLAVLGLLNARNATETVMVDQVRLNRARFKRGKAPLMEHKILKIAHRQVQRVYPDGARHATHAPMRGHFVMGHWKVRKSGIYFWRPFARGHFDHGTVTKDYRL